jgi:hypothetical protein
MLYRPNFNLQLNKVKQRGSGYPGKLFSYDENMACFDPLLHSFILGSDWCHLSNQRKVDIAKIYFTAQIGCALLIPLGYYENLINRGLPINR